MLTAYALASLLAMAADATPPPTPAETATPPADSSETPSDEEMRRLSESLAADQKPAAAALSCAATPLGTIGAALQSMNPDMSFIFDAAGAYFSQGEPLQLGGHDPTETGFNLQQLELHVAANVDPFLRFESNVVFGLFGVEVEEAFATTLALPANLQLRAGQFLTRLGRINATHPHAWSFADQPLVIGKFFGSEGNRGLGTEVSWLSPLPWFAEVVGSATGAAGECCARSYLGADDLTVRTPNDLLYTTALKQFFPLSDDWSILWGLSGQFGPNASGEDNRTALYATDLYLRYRPIESAGRSSVSWQTELMWRRSQVPSGLLADAGGYSQVSWRCSAEWETGARYEHVAGAPDDPLDPEWNSARHRYAAQLTYYPSHFSRLRLQGSYDAPSWRDRGVWSAFLALELLAGAHGAHGY
jgi:hypothetical protein